jgi:hypothetical protein
MKLFKLAPIAGVLLATTSSFAAEPVADIKIYAAGASAQLGSISGILTSLCKPNGGGNQIEFYQGFGTSTGGTSATAVNNNLRAFRCALADNATSPSLNGKTVLFAYSAIDGSASGVQYVARQLNRKFLNFDACPTAPTTTSTAATQLATPVGSAQFNCTGTGAGSTSTTTTQDKVPSAGASDVEPARFDGVNTPLGETAIAAADIDNLNIKAGRAVIFGVYGNKAMWLELQKRQGLIPASATEPIMPFTTAGTVATALTNTANPLFTEALRPNITKAEYRAIAKGDLNNMLYLTGTETPTSGTVNAGPLQLARRVAGSGTQAISNIFFLNNSCGVATSSQLAPSGAVTSASFNVTLGSGTSDVINQFQIKTTPVVGVISLENPSRGDYTLAADAIPRAAYAALKLDGVVPNRANTISGRYEFFAEETFQWNKNVITSGSLAEDFLNRFTDAGALVSTLQSLTSAVQEGSAALADYNGGSPAANTTWIMNSTRTGNNCAPALKIIE